MRSRNVGCRICDEVLLRGGAPPPALRCMHGLVTGHATFRCPPGSHNFGADPTVDCVAKIVVTSSFNDAEVQLCEHPNVVRHIETCRLNDSESVVVTEYCKSGNLVSIYSEQRRKVRSDDQIVSLLVQLLLTLHHLHSKCNLMHRDISVNNVFVASTTGDGRHLIRLGDFGCAKRRHEASVGDSDFHSYVGTKPYMPPEIRAPGESVAYNSTADIFSAAAVIFQYITGEIPFPEEGVVCFTPEHKNMILRRGEEAAGLGLSHEQYPFIADLVERMLSFDPHRRPKAAGIFADCRFMADGLRLWSERFESGEHGALTTSGNAVEVFRRQVVVLTNAVDSSHFVGRFRRQKNTGPQSTKKMFVDIYFVPNVALWAVRLKNKQDAVVFDVQDVERAEVGYQPVGDEEEEEEEDESDAKDPVAQRVARHRRGEIHSDDDDEDGREVESHTVDLWVKTRKHAYTYATTNRQLAAKLNTMLRSVIPPRK